MDFFNVQDFRQHGHALIDQLADYLDQSLRAGDDRELLSTDGSFRKVIDFRECQDLYQEWRSQEPGQPFSSLVSRLLEQSIRLHHTGFAGHQISPVVPVSALAGLVNDLLNNGMGIYEMGMAGTAIERVVVEMAARQFGFDGRAGGVLTSGGSLGNLTALLTAFNHYKKKRQDQMPGAGHPLRPVLLVSEQAHYCVQRSAAIMGWPADSVIKVGTDDQFRMDLLQLKDCLALALQDRLDVVAVIGSACTTATGSYDDLPGIAKVCHEHDVWFHVDGAHGAAAAFSDKYRCRVQGIELADSVVMDFHKMLLTPALATVLVFRDHRLGYETFAQKADYLFRQNVASAADEISANDPSTLPWHDIALRSFECTKFMIGFKVFAIYNQYGLEAWNQNVSRLFELASQFADMIERTPQLGLLVHPQANIVCYRYAAGNDADSNLVNEAIRRSLLESGAFYIVQTKIDDVVWLRSTFSNSRANECDLNQLIRLICESGQRQTA